MDCALPTFTGTRRFVAPRWSARSCARSPRARARPRGRAHDRPPGRKDPDRVRLLPRGFRRPGPRPVAGSLGRRAAGRLALLPGCRRMAARLPCLRGAEMSGRAQLVLSCAEIREKAIRWIRQAKPGTRVEFKDAQRTPAQNDRMWAMLTDIVTQHPRFNG